MSGDQLTPEALVGQFFHGNLDPNRDHNDNPGWQGIVVALVSPGLYQVQLFSWLDGGPSERRLVRLTDMLACEWRFFSEREEWDHMANEFFKRQRRQQEAELRRERAGPELSGPVGLRDIAPT